MRENKSQIPLDPKSLAKLAFERMLVVSKRNPQFAQRLTGQAFEHFGDWMPGMIVKTPQTVVFKHPKPNWEQHLLAVPKKEIANITAIDFSDPEYVSHVLDLLKSIREAAALAGLINYGGLSNWGKGQAIPQIHFHVFSGKSVDGGRSLDEIYESAQKGVIIAPHTIDPHGSGLLPFENLNLDNPGIASEAVDLFQRAQEVIKTTGKDGYQTFFFNLPDYGQPNMSLFLVPGNPVNQEQL
jgi:diadenosine tetraphosphate (Ap4A) HIT family hydrolase